MNYKKLFLVLLFSFALFIRLYNYENRFTFGSEQARSLVVSGNYIKDKPSFLGQEQFRVTSQGHKLFSGALFSYSLVPLQLLFNFDPVPISIFFVILNVATGALLFFLVQKAFGFKTAFFSTTLFLFSAHMINHSMFIWILNYYPAIGLLAAYFIYLFHKKEKSSLALLLGVVSGVGFNFHYLFLPFAVGIFVYLAVRSKKKVKSLALFLLGALIGNFTMIAFDVRHDFYHLRILLEYSHDVFTGIGEKNASLFHLLNIWPLLAVVGGIALGRLFKKSRVLALSVLVIYIFLNLFSNLVDFSKPVGMPKGLFYRDILAASDMIAEDATYGSFNVSSLLDFDKRGYVLRYPLKFLYDSHPMGVEDYPVSDKLYVLAETNYNFDESGVWEVRIFDPFTVIKLGDVGQGYEVLRLDRVN
jgi:hypothetical protein